MTTDSNTTRKGKTPQGRTNGRKTTRPRLRFEDGRPIEIRIELAVLVEYGLRPSELAVYVAIVSFASYDDKTAYPSFNKIAERSGVSRASVIRATARLEELGLLRVKRDTHDGVHSVNVYTVTMATPGWYHSDTTWSQNDTGVVSQSNDGSSTEQPKRKPLNINQEQRVQDAIAPASEPSKAKPKPARKPRPTDAYYEAIVDAFGYDRARITKTQAGNIGKVATELYHAGYDAEDVAEIYKWCKRQKWTGGFTVNALTTQAANWAAARPHRSGTPAMHVPLAEHDDMLDALLEDVG